MDWVILQALACKFLGLALIPVAFSFFWEAARILSMPRWQWDEERRCADRARTERAQALAILNAIRSRRS